MSRRVRDVGILGATGIVGQQLVRRLSAHPWFRTCWLGASERSAGRRYGDLPWWLPGAPPEAVRDLVVESPAPGRPPELVFSALDAPAAEQLEAALASFGHVVVSNASRYRLDADVPLVVPEINPDHLALVAVQRQQRNWRGAIVTNPNCSTIFLALVLGAVRRFQPRRVLITTLQAASGAGHPGVPSWDLLGNVIPFIDGEEAKIERETTKILGALDGDHVVDHGVVISAQCTRVPVLDGHTESVSIEFSERPSCDQLREALHRFALPPGRPRLPSAPTSPILVLPERDRPQPRLDVERGDGMSVSIGRLRDCPVLHCKLVALGHNTIRGAAGAAVLNAELLVADGWLGGNPLGDGVPLC